MKSISFLNSEALRLTGDVDKCSFQMGVERLDALFNTFESEWRKEFPNNWLHKFVIVINPRKSDWVNLK